MVKKLLLALIISAPIVSNIVWSNELKLLKRIERLERIIQGQGLVSLLARIEQHQNEIQRLSGGTEILKHELNKIQQRQSELYSVIEQWTEIGALGIDEGGMDKIFDLSSVTGQKLTIKKTVGKLVMVSEAIGSDETTVTAPLVQLKKISNINIMVPVDNGELAYQSALQTLRSGQYEQAAAAWKAFPEQYPHSSYLPNVFYWQGETNYVLRNFDQAIVAFQTVINQFITSNKVADAMLKQGFSQYELGQVGMAKKTLIAVMQKYPNTSVSRLARARLNRIRRQIH